MAQLHRLNRAPEHPEAALLVVKNFVDYLLKDEGLTKEDMFREQAILNVDKKAFMKGRVVNKKARWNLCFDDESRDPDYENKKGRIVALDEVAITKRVAERFIEFFGPKAGNLKGEGNYYYDIKTCGIGFHGDGERRKVVAIRLGASLPMHYQWFLKSEPVGERMIFPVDGGDIYVMSEKAVGTDWLKKNTYTLRHATGCKEFTTIKPKTSSASQQDES